MKKNSLSWGWLIVVALIGGAFIFFMDYAFRNYEVVRGLFSGTPGGVLGEVSANSEASLAVKAELSARISMFLFRSFPDAASASLQVFSLREMAFSAGCCSVPPTWFLFYPER